MTVPTSATNSTATNATKTPPGGAAPVAPVPVTPVPPVVAVAAEPESIPGWNFRTEPGADRLDAELLLRAYRFSAKAHEGQKRSSGEDYVTHCVEVAKILAGPHLDAVTVASGLIHDVVEDTKITVADVEREFGKDMASIVDGVTKIGNIPFRSRQERSIIVSASSRLAACASR